ncbi:MAG: transglutaminase domain-containing protein [Planctomycetia bacterium]|nr:transglutaminase domain-containing protein [Planctomycetia bacterium]
MKRMSLATVLGAALGCALLGDAGSPSDHVVSKAGKSKTFAAKHELKVNVPEGAKKVRVWFTMPQDDTAQTVADLKVETAAKYTIEKDSEGNQSIYVASDGSAREISITATFTVTRRETLTDPDPAKTRPLTDEERKAMARYLGANRNVVINDEIRKLAKEIAGEETNPVKVARKIYDWVLANIEYWVKDPNNKKASPVGSTEYCLTSKTGNCTDFHSLWTSLARAAGIPTRMVYGSFFKAELDGKDADQSYHCWPEFWVPEIGWIPHDVAVADIFVGDFTLNADNEPKVKLTTADGYTGPDKAKVDWYFGNLDERRVTWSRGRDLELSPKPDAGPVNALAKAYVEIDGQATGEKSADGKTVNWTRKLTFTEKK